MTKHLVEDFIAYWSAASASERSNSQRFLVELCDLLDVPRPDNHPNNGYFFEYPVTEHHVDGTTSPGWIDLCKRGCFVLESKQFLEAKAKASPLERSQVASREVRDGLPKTLPVDHRISLRRSNTRVSEGVAYEVKIAGLLVQSGREGVPQTMRRVGRGESGAIAPVREAHLNLSSSDSSNIA